MKKTVTMRRKVFFVLEAEGQDRGVGSWIRLGIVLLILLNVAAVILETHPPLAESYQSYFSAFEVFSIAVFTVEYVLRLWVSPGHVAYQDQPHWKARLRYAFSWIAIVDLLAVLPFYLGMLLPVDLRQLRALRLLRLLKLSHFFPGVGLFVSVLRRELPALMAAALVMSTLVVVSAITMFLLEREAQPEAFGTVPHSMWWAVVTLTTVGYGDITPVTLWGRLLAMLIMLLGVGVVALPAAMLAGRFSDELQIQREILFRNVAGFLKDGLLDADERAKVERARREIGLSDDAVNEIINEAKEVQDVKQQRHRCPSCGHRFSLAG